MINDVHGHVVGVAGIGEDITDRKRSQELMLQAQRDRAVADLASGVAHNFNNLLQIVLGSASFSLISMELEDYTSVRESLERIVESCKFGAETIRRLNRFARPEYLPKVSEIEVFDLSDLVRQAVEMTTPWWRTTPEKAGNRIDLETRLKTSCQIKGNKNEIFEVLVSLIKNAAEALPEGGDIEIETFLQRQSGGTTSPGHGCRHTPSESG